MALRAQLSAKPTDEWQKAKCLMDEITRVLGHRGGPMGGSIAKRACVYCHIYGHTRAHCRKLIALERSAMSFQPKSRAVAKHKAAPRAVSCALLVVRRGVRRRNASRSASTQRVLCFECGI